MASEFQPLEDLADAVLEGNAIDWTSAESSAGEPDREAVRQLKVLAAIADLHRNLLLDQPELARPQATEAEPRRWGRLQILERIGRGAFGEVFRAWDSKLDREVAVKLLHESGSRPEGATVLKEARLLARVRHPNVVTVYDADEFNGRVGLWMEFIHGQNLEEVLRERKRLDDREVTRIGIELCRALSAVHEAGLLHRDVKAQNLMQTIDGRLILMDFGTGRELAHAPGAVMHTEAPLDPPPEAFKTAPATVQAGTPLYLAPEVFRGAPATVRTDIYSAGVLLFHLLTGSYPIFGATIEEVADAHASGQRADLAATAPGVNRALAAAIERAIRPDPSGRFDSARGLLGALDSVQHKAEAGKRRRYRLGLGTVFLLAVVFAVVQGMRRDRGRGTPRPAGIAYAGSTPERRAVHPPPHMLLGRPSSDGQYLPYSELGTGNLAIYEFATGEHRVLTKSGDGGDHYATESIISPDNGRVAYCWTDGSFDRVQLRVIDATGENLRILDSSPNPTSILPLEWSPDGRHILGTRQRGGGETDVILVSVENGSVRTVRSFPHGPWNMALSPDGRYVAYDRAEDSEDKDRGIYLSTLDGSQEAPVVTGPTYDSHPNWTPDGSGLVFASMRTGGPGLWLQPIKDGRPDGPPRLVEKDMGPFAPITLTRRGSLFYRHRVGLMDVYTARIDPATGDVVGEPVNAASSFLGSNIAPDWSPDGATLVFASWRTLFGPGRNILVFHPLSTGRDRELELDMDVVNNPRWSPRGDRIAVAGPDRKQVRALRFIDATSGRILSTFFAQPGDAPLVTAVEWALDGRHAYLRMKQRIWRFDPETGHEEAVYQPPPDAVMIGPSISPDGQWLALVLNQRSTKTSRLLAIPAGGGSPRELLSAPLGPGRLAPGGWTRDGRHLLFTRTASVGKERKPIGALWAVPFDGGPARSVGLTMPSLRDIRVSPDGSRVCFTSGFPDQEMWVFENFLPQISR